MTHTLEINRIPTDGANFEVGNTGHMANRRTKQLLAKLMKLFWD